MNKLSMRLQVVADYIDDKDRAMIDIGCDHGLLAIYLAKKYENLRITASDVNENALLNAVLNIKNNGLEKRIETRLGSGLDVITPDDKIDTVVIAGMGANTIVGILKYAGSRLEGVNKIIIQSNTDLFFLRKNMMMIGYYIEDEKLVKDKGIIYTVMMFKKGKRRYNYKELYLGPVLIKEKDDLFKEKVLKELKTNRMILNNIKSGHYWYKRRIKKNVKILEECEKDMK